MCAVSMIYDYGRQRIPENEWTLEKWNHYQELIKNAQEFDKAAKQPDCESDEKKEWMKSIEERLKSLEEKSLTYIFNDFGLVFNKPLGYP